MGLKTRTQLKTRFETNDVPLAADYVDLIDSSPNFKDDSPTFGFSWEGNWADTTTYHRYDAVFYATTGSSYVCKLAHSPYFVPTNTTYWDKIASGGGGFDWIGDWETGYDYVANNVVQESGNTYICITDHTSGTFATDLAAGKWALMASKGSDGTPGANGTNGTDGADGTDGAAATIAVGTVTTVDNTDPATVTNVGTSSAAILDFDIPKGADGAGSGDFLKDGSVAMTGTFQTVAGTLTVAPIKMTAGTNLTTPVAGVIEFDGSDYYVTI